MNRSNSAWHRLDLLLARVRPYREPLSLVVDAAVIALCWNITYLFRLGFERWMSARPAYDLWVLLGVVVVYLIAFAVLRVPQSMWRFSGFGEVKRLTLACVAAGVVSAAVVIGLGLTKVPRAVLALHPAVALMGVCLARIAYRMVYEHARSRITGGAAEVRRALVLGAGAAARMLVAGIHEQGWVVLGLLDDDPAKRRARIGGVPVLGPLEAVRDKAVRGAATHIVIALPSASPAQRRHALELAGSTGLPVLTVPTVDELREGKSRIERLRDIEPEDLLGREPVQLDEAGIGHTLAGKTVLISGAGGSIGSELCRQVARFGPARLVLYEQSEFNLYTIEQELGEAFPRMPLVRLIGDVNQDSQRHRWNAGWIRGGFPEMGRHIRSQRGWKWHGCVVQQPSEIHGVRRALQVFGQSRAVCHRQVRLHLPNDKVAALRPGCDELWRGKPGRPDDTGERKNPLHLLHELQGWSRQPQQQCCDSRSSVDGGRGPPHGTRGKPLGLRVPLRRPQPVH